MRFSKFSSTRCKAANHRRLALLYWNPKPKPPRTEPKFKPGSQEWFRELQKSTLRPGESHHEMFSGELAKTSPPAEQSRQTVWAAKPMQSARDSDCRVDRISRDSDLTGSGVGGGRPASACRSGEIGSKTRLLSCMIYAQNFVCITKLPNFSHISRILHSANGA